MIALVDALFKACASSNLLKRLQVLNLGGYTKVYEKNYHGDPLYQLPPNIRFLRLYNKDYFGESEFMLADNITPAGVLDNIRALSLKMPEWHNYIARFRKYLYEFNLLFTFQYLVSFIWICAWIELVGRRSGHH
jgi:hypothetical protein